MPHNLRHVQEWLTLGSVQEEEEEMPRGCSRGCQTSIDCQGADHRSGSYSPHTCPNTEGGLVMRIRPELG